MELLKQFTPDIEIYSGDQSFLEFKGLNNYNFNDYGNQIRQRILNLSTV